MSTQTEEIKTDNIKVAMTRKPGCQIKLDMHVSPAGTKAAYSKAVKAINKEASIPGFRKGKAPESMIVQKFENFITKEWHDILINTAFQEFLEKTRLFPFASSQKSVKKVEMKNADKDSGSQILIEYEARPEVPEIEFSSIHLKPVKKGDVTPEEIEETIHQVQLKLAKWEEITDRPIQEGDFVDLDIEALESPPRTVCTDMRFEVAQGRMGSWMRQLLIGRTANETVEGMSEKEDNLLKGEEGAHFKSTLCRITIRGVKTAQLPDLNDELAQKIGLKTMDELRPKVEQDLHKRAEEEVQDQLRAQVEDSLLELYKFDIPSSLIDKQRKEMIRSRVHEHHGHQHSKEDMQKLTQEIEASVDQELDRAYRLYFLTNQFAEQRQIRVFENELMNEMMKQLTLPPGQGIIDNGMSPEDVRSKLYVNVLSQKVLDYIAIKAGAPIPESANQA